MTRQSLKGIPQNLRTLARSGQRVRYNGFWLNESEQDRAIAQWLDDTAQAGTIIKHILYMYLSGNTSQIVVKEQPEDFEPDETANALLSFED